MKYVKTYDKNMRHSGVMDMSAALGKKADIEYVDELIQAATATFRGTYNVVNDLSLAYNATHSQIEDALATKMAALSIVPDNNDYSFVQIPMSGETQTEIAKVEKYTYNGSAWAYEYELNNSGFTDAQWSAINSGATLELIGKLSALPTNAELTTLLNAKVSYDDNGAYDVSAHNSGATFASLSDLLSNENIDTLIPAAVRKGGMSIRFVRTSDNKYVQYRLMADEFTTDTTQWAIADEGVYVENPEFVYVKTDSEGKILWAINPNGTIYYGAGTPPQIASLLNGKVDKEPGKSLIDAGFSDSNESIGNPEFSKVSVDSNGKIIEGIAPDGTKIVFVPVNLFNINVLGKIENPEWKNVKTDKNGKIIWGINENGEVFIPDLYNPIVKDNQRKLKDATKLLDDTVPVVNNLRNTQTAYFRFDSELLNVTDEMNGIDMTAVDSIGCETFQDQIYAKIDGLLTDYSDVLEKVDLAEFVEETYPEYANLGGVASGNYLPTPTYKTYMYKYHRSDGVASTGVTAERQKVLVVAGLHGWENASQLNTFIFLSKLCQNASIDYLNLASSCDFYIIPCVNGYGAYHHNRANANYIDINRNFPTSKWEPDTYTEVSELPSSPTVNQKIKPLVNIEYNNTTLYSGAVYYWTGSTWTLYYTYGGDVAGSEFETKLLMKLVNKIHPDIYIDHHSYGPDSNYNFYVEICTDNEKRLMYQILFDWTYRAWKEYPDYYPEKFETKPNSFSTSTTNYSTSKNWSFEKGVADSITLEVCLGIRGVPYSTYGIPIVRLNELMLRLTLEKLISYQLIRGINSNII